MFVSKHDSVPCITYSPPLLPPADEFCLLGRDTTDAEYLDRLDKLHKGKSAPYGNSRLRQVRRAAFQQHCGGA